MSWHDATCSACHARISDCQCVLDSDTQEQREAWVEGLKLYDAQTPEEIKRIQLRALRAVSVGLPDEGYDPKSYSTFQRQTDEAQMYYLEHAL